MPRRRPDALSSVEPLNKPGKQGIEPTFPCDPVPELVPKLWHRGRPGRVSPSKISRNRLWAIGGGPNAKCRDLVASERGVRLGEVALLLEACSRSTRPTRACRVPALDEAPSPSLRWRDAAGGLGAHWKARADRWRLQLRVRQGVSRPTRRPRPGASDQPLRGPDRDPPAELRYSAPARRPPGCSYGGARLVNDSKDLGLGAAPVRLTWWSAKNPFAKWSEGGGARRRSFRAQPDPPAAGSPLGAAMAKRMASCRCDG